MTVAALLVIVGLSEAALQGEGLPSFRPLPIEAQLDIPRQITEISGTTTGSRKTGFTHSYVTVSGSDFTNCWAQGAGIAKGSGGAVYVILSSLWVSSSRFDHCSAVLGGAISLVFSDASLQGTTWFGCRSYFMAGAVYCGCDVSLRGLIESGTWGTQGVTMIKDCVFQNCSAKEYHGALTFSQMGDVCIDHCQFVFSYAACSGGAIGISMSSVAIFSSLFFKNFVGGRMLNDTGLNSFHNSVLNHSSRDFRVHTKYMPRMPRGGGAIIALWLEDRPGWNKGNKSPDLATQDCCFYGNECQKDWMDIRDSTFDKGFDILVGGLMMYQAYEDRFWNAREYSILLTMEGTVDGYRAQMMSYGTRFYDGIASKFVIGACAEWMSSGYAINTRSVPRLSETVTSPRSEVTTKLTSGLALPYIDVSTPRNTNWSVRTPRATDSGRTQIKTYSKPGRSLTRCSGCSVASWTATAVFTRSSIFSRSSAFTKTKQFTRSSTFSLSGAFTRTKQFTRSSIFSLSGAFTLSDSGSSRFTASKPFTMSSMFSRSSVFSKTEQFTMSSMFSRSSFFTKTKQFTASSIFSRSSAFTKTKQFTGSTTFTESGIFTESHVPKASNPFKMTSHFSESKPFSQSDSFTTLSSGVSYSASIGITLSVSQTIRSSYTSDGAFGYSVTFIPVTMIISFETLFYVEVSVVGKRLSAGQLIGIVVGSATVVFLAIGFIIYFVRRRHEAESVEGESVEEIAETNLGTEVTTETCSLNPIDDDDDWL